MPAILALCCGRRVELDGWVVGCGLKGGGCWGAGVFWGRLSQWLPPCP